ncbi:MAG: N-6 DNA methylase [Pirellulales bacterium]|nr:N-6 DNA methylase [Pirellulales bacterium]
MPRHDERTKSAGAGILPRRDVLDWWVRLSGAIADNHPELPIEGLEVAARRALQRLMFTALCQIRGLAPWNVSAEGEADDIPALPADLHPHAGREAMEAVRSQIKQRFSNAEVGRCDGLLGEVHQQLLGMGLKRERRAVRGVRNASGRKAAGVYYTPRFITDYVVENTLGRWLDGSPSVPAAGNEIRLIDPACGCGSFLISACRRYLAWARQNRVASPAAATARILHGVDLDPEAVAIARNCLWLELGNAIGSSAEAREAGALLESNLRCGDVLLDEQDCLHGSFDFVVGNPPYRRELNSKQLFDRVAGSRLGQFRWPRMDYWHYFAHRGLELLRCGGRLAFIVNAYWTAGRGAERLIAALRETAGIDEVFLLGDARVFNGVAGRHMILSLTKGPARGSVTVKRPLPGPSPDADAIVRDEACLQVFQKTPEQLFRAGRLDLEPPDTGLLARIAAGTPLEELGRVRQGIAENPASVTSSANARHQNRWAVGEGVFTLTSAEISRLELPESELRLVRPYYDLRDLGRYWLAEEPSLRLIYATAETWPELVQWPVLAGHLARFRPIMEARRETRQGLRPWWHLHWPRDGSLWESDKIVALQMARRPAFVPATGTVYVPFSANVFVPDEHAREHLSYFAAILNSRLLWHWYRHHAKRRGVGLEINGRILARTPIRRIDFSDPSETARHAEIVDLTAEMLRLNRLVRRAGPSSDPEKMLSQVEQIDRQIDQMVYELYGLTSEEISLIHASEQATD